MPNHGPLPDGMLHTTRIECNVTFRCNAICNSCNKGVGLVRFEDTDMTVPQMKRAVDQLIEQKIHVPRFTFCGGEPILNKNLQGLIDEVARLPTLQFGRILTNGMPVSKPLRDKIKLPDKRFFWVENPLDDPNDPLSGKKQRRKRPNGRVHSPFWISPVDVGKHSEFKYCRVQGWCGIGLDSTGWSMCGKAVMFGKLFGIDPTMKEGDIIQHARTPIEDLCKHCQYGLEDGLKGERELYRLNKSGKLPDISPTFVEAFKRHKECGDLVQLVPL